MEGVTDTAVEALEEVEEEDTEEATDLVVVVEVAAMVAATPMVILVVETEMAFHNKGQPMAILVDKPMAILVEVATDTEILHNHSQFRLNFGGATDTTEGAADLVEATALGVVTVSGEGILGMVEVTEVVVGVDVEAIEDLEGVAAAEVVLVVEAEMRVEVSEVEIGIDLAVSVVDAVAVGVDFRIETVAPMAHPPGKMDLPNEMGHLHLADLNKVVLHH